MAESVPGGVGERQKMDGRGWDLHMFRIPWFDCIWSSEVVGRRYAGSGKPVRAGALRAELRRLRPGMDASCDLELVNMFDVSEFDFLLATN